MFDNRLVHASYPNYTDRPRVAVAIGLRPAGTPLTYFRRSGPDTADRYDIDSSFFLTTTPQGLFAEAPDLPVVETVPVDAVDLGAEDRNVEPGVAADQRVERPDNPLDASLAGPRLLVQLHGSPETSTPCPRQDAGDVTVECGMTLVSGE